MKPEERVMGVDYPTEEELSTWENKKIHEKYGKDWSEGFKNPPEYVYRILKRRSMEEMINNVLKPLGVDATVEELTDALSSLALGDREMTAKAIAFLCFTKGIDIEKMMEREE